MSKYNWISEPIQYDTSNFDNIMRKYKIIGLLERKGFQTFNCDPSENKGQYAFEMRMPMDNRLCPPGSVIIRIYKFMLEFGDLFGDSIDHIVDSIIQMYENTVPKK